MLTLVRAHVVGVRGAGLCAYCGAPAEGLYKVHRDDFGVGPEVDLCNACGGGPLPKLKTIRRAIGQVKKELSR